MIIGVLKEEKEFENRVAATPETVKKLVGFDQDIWIEKNAGISSFINDQDYIDAGAKIVARNEVLNADLILQVQAMSAKDINNLNSKQFIVGLLEPFNKELKATILDKNISAFALELLPRNSRAQSMDVLSSQANIAGYKAVMLAADTY